MFPKGQAAGKTGCSFIYFFMEMIMTQDIFQKLREQMDQYSVGFPATKSGVEIKILKKMFNEEQAKIYLDMTMMLEDPASIASRTGRDADALAKELEIMAKEGLLFRKRSGDQVKYAAVAFVIGSYEFQLKSMDRELAELVDQYFEEGFMDFSPGTNIPPLRTVPVHQAIEIRHQVAPHSHAKEIIKTKDKIALADCICRHQKELIDQGCKKPLEVCLSFGSHADYYVENGMGRYITQEEALAVLDKAEEAGLVNQPANMVNPGGMCNCCGDCCGLLRALNRLPKPAESVFNNYFAQVDESLCTSCETCADRCQMNAIDFEGDGGTARILTDRCIGCGLCVSTCPTEAIQIELKPEDQRVAPPDGGKDLMMRTADMRGTSVIPLSMQ